MNEWCGCLGKLCGSSEDMIVCYLCLDKVHHTIWTTGEHRIQCASRNTSQLSSFSVHATLTCLRCSAKLKYWPAQGPGFSCDSDSILCPNKNKLIQSTGKNRLNCFPCDFDLCEYCSEQSEDVTNSETTKSKKNLKHQMLQKNCLLKEDENQNNVSSVNTKASLLNDADNIPLIDVQSSTEDIPDQVSSESRRHKSASLHQRSTAFDARSKSVASLGFTLLDPQTGKLEKQRLGDSPDIFNLRAPLVSCENILTPTTSKEGINQITPN
ncbi:uncharacterized protein LOC111716997 [Eurytemora carolleeae]|uniref:uncharacterized protein LOC111716997 n=1 Tax=Eurytemora carolleeae TaxID=1294199 RepID=UPI000C77B018|nr:uncharacterized protein LOC111716997 [Eurytemora carolleeae]|eukprot:XP_023348312.1 uncharacterized protein LOC111716997 [Eurytemora affinis]